MLYISQRSPKHSLQTEIEECYTFKLKQAHLQRKIFETTQIINLLIIMPSALLLISH